MNKFGMVIAGAMMLLMTLFASVAPTLANDSTIDQNGPCNVALVTQSGANGSWVLQANNGNCGKGNLAIVDQWGGNVQATVQDGKRNGAFTQQWGFGNGALTVQDGNRNDSVTGQYGNGNLGGAVQVGKDNQSEVWQVGSWNLGGALQVGDNNSSSVVQDGNGNVGVAVQGGNNNSSSINQDGSNNGAFVSQQSW